MAGVLGPASQRINADVAGLTHVPEPNPGQPAGVIGHEVTSEVLPTEKGGLEHIFNDGLLPDPAQVVERAVVKPTSSIAGRLGGLVPKMTEAVHPGPATQTAHLATDVEQKVAPATATVGTMVARARKFLGF